MYTFFKLHMTPKDYLAQFEEFEDAEFSHVDYFIEPYGSHEYNEMSDTHYAAGDIVGYHEHTRGYETFLIDKGSVEITINGKRTIAQKGDMVHIPPYTSHMFRFLEHDTIWRELFQEIRMNPGMMDHLRLRKHYPERHRDKAFNARERQRSGSAWFDFEPNAETVSKYAIPQVRPYDFGLAVHEIGGIVLRQKVNRAETAGVKEIWQLIVQASKRLVWDERNPFPLLMVVYSGKVHVTLDNGIEFTANERDILHLPNYIGGSIQAEEDTVLLDNNCEGFLLRALEEIKAKKAASALDPERVKEILQKHDYHIYFE